MPLPQLCKTGATLEHLVQLTPKDAHALFSPPFETKLFVSGQIVDNFLFNNNPFRFSNDCVMGVSCNPSQGGPSALYKYTFQFMSQGIDMNTTYELA